RDARVRTPCRQLAQRCAVGGDRLRDETLVVLHAGLCEDGGGRALSRRRAGCPLPAESRRGLRRELPSPEPAAAGRCRVALAGRVERAVPGRYRALADPAGHSGSLARQLAVAAVRVTDEADEDADTEPCDAARRSL